MLLFLFSNFKLFWIEVCQNLEERAFMVGIKTKGVDLLLCRVCIYNKP